MRFIPHPEVAEKLRPGAKPGLFQPSGRAVTQDWVTLTLPGGGARFSPARPLPESLTNG